MAENQTATRYKGIFADVNTFGVCMIQPCVWTNFGCFINIHAFENKVSPF